MSRSIMYSICALVAVVFLFIVVLESSQAVDTSFAPPVSYVRRLTSDSEPLSVTFDTTEADELRKKVRIFCVILTQRKSYENRAKTVRETWARECHQHIFVSNETVDGRPDIMNLVEDGSYEALPQKTKNGLEYAYNTALNESNWFLKADDDSFYIMENLRDLLSTLNTSEPQFLGREFKIGAKLRYMSGGAGYVLSREALRLFVEEGMHNGKCKMADTGCEDLIVGDCLHKVGVRTTPSADMKSKRHRFHSFASEFMVTPTHVKPSHWWIYDYDVWPFYRQGLDGASSSSVSFHYQSWESMPYVQYLIRTARAFRGSS